MIYVKNDFYSNFNGAIRSNDDVTVRDIMIDQISTIIAKDRRDVVTLLKSVGIKLSKTPSNEEISKKIIANISDNSKLRVGIAFLIANNNDLIISEEQKSNFNWHLFNKNKKKSNSGSSNMNLPDFTKDTTNFTVPNVNNSDKKNKPKIDWNKASNSITLIASSLSSIFTSLHGGQRNDFESELNSQSNNKAPNYSTDSKNTTKNIPQDKKSYKGLLIASGIVVLLSTAIFIAYKKGAFKKG